MLDIESKYSGAGIFDIAKKLIQKSSTGAIAKKVLNSATAKKVLNSTTAKNLKRAANSAIGQEIKKSVLTGVTEASKNAAEGAFAKLGLPAPPPQPTQAPLPKPPAAKKRKKRVRKKSRKGQGIVLD